MDIEILSEKTVSIPATQDPAYHSWADMKARCLNPKHGRFERYGGRGITVCDEWVNSFVAFWWDMGGTWFEGAQIHRVDNDGHYNQQNCCWLTRGEHARKSGRDRIRSLAITLPEANPPIVAATQIFEVGGMMLQARLTITNNLLVSTAQEQDPNDLLTTKQAAKRMSLHPDTVSKMARLEELASVKVGKRERRFEPSVIDAWIRAHRHA